MTQQPISNSKVSGMKIACEIYSRVVGYYRPVNQWNPGKQSEFNDRKEGDVKHLTN